MNLTKLLQDLYAETANTDVRNQRRPKLRDILSS